MAKKTLRRKDHLNSFIFQHYEFEKLGLLQGLILKAWTPKSQIRGNPWVPLGSTLNKLIIETR
jgi:hypothetical protein